MLVYVASFYTRSCCSSRSPASMGGRNEKRSSLPVALQRLTSTPTTHKTLIVRFFCFYLPQNDPRKVNICVGAYRDEEGKPWVLPSVKAAETILLNDPNSNKEYLPIEGDVDFIDKAIQFAYGANIDLNTIAAVQSLSGTGACRIAGHFLAQFYPNKPILIPNPTWGNHYKIFQACGLTTHTYRYYSRSNNALDLNGLLDDWNAAENGSIVLLHACAHNPTGCDPTLEQFEQMIQVLERKQHVVLLDSAYQGFASGNAERDAALLRLLVAHKTIPLMLAQSFAKNFGLYGERCGTFSVVCGNATQKARILSQLRCIVRPMYSSPPRHGSSIVKTVLSNPTLSAQYYQECATMAARIQSTRHRLVEKLREVGSQHDWSHVTTQIGMFAFTGMTEAMCDQLTNEYAIYLTRDGRISLAGLNDGNLEYVAKAIHAVTHGHSISG